MGKKDEIHLFSQIFTLRANWRLPSAALLRVRNSTTYGFTLKCLAYESLQFVQNSGNKIYLKIKYRRLRKRFFRVVPGMTLKPIPYRFTRINNHKIESARWFRRRDHFSCSTLNLVVELFSSYILQTEIVFLTT